jgi:hypothetical protein
MNVSWSASTDTGGSGLRGYRVHRNGSFLKLVLAPATSTSDTGLGGGTVYGYAVSSLDHAGNESARSATLNANTPACPDTTPPSVPGGLAAVAATCSRVDVSWSASSDAGGSGLAGYNLYRNGAFLRYVAAPATATADGGVTASTSYSYAASAVDGAGNESARSTAAGTTTPSCAGGLPELVGFVPAVGGAKDVVVGGNGLAYVASMEFGLTAVDVRTPGQPVAIGAANPPFYAERAAIDGTLAAVTGNGAGLRIVDLSDPTAPRTLGALSGTMAGVALDGRYAFVLLVVPGNPGHTDLVSVDLRDPSAPAIAGRVTLAGGLSVQLVGTLAYVAAGRGGFQIVDVSDPADPTIVGGVDTPGTAYAVAVGNGWAFVADDASVIAIDVRNPAAPVVRGTLGTPATAVALAGARLYALGATQLKVIDVTNPAAPALLGTPTNAFGAQRLAVSGNTLFMASPEIDVGRGLGGLYVLDVAGTPRVLANTSGRFDDTGIAIDGTRGVVTGNGLGLKVVDVADPHAPRVVGALSGTTKDVAMAGPYAYVLLVVPGNPSHTDLLVIDVSGATPVTVGRTTLAGGLGIRVVGGLAYVAAGNAGLQIVDIGNPAAPRSAGIVDTAGTAYRVAVVGDLAFVADGSALVVVDVSRPSQPAIRGSLTTPATAVAAAGSRAYVLGGNQLKAVDARNPAAPALLGALASLGQGIDLLGNVAFVATPAINHHDPTGGVSAIDVTDPTRMRVVTQIKVPGITRVVCVSGGRVYAGDGAAIVDVIEP